MFSLDEYLSSSLNALGWRYLVVPDVVIRVALYGNQISSRMGNRIRDFHPPIYSRTWLVALCGKSKAEGVIMSI